MNFEIEFYIGLNSHSFKHFTPSHFETHSHMRARARARTHAHTHTLIHTQRVLLSIYYMYMNFEMSHFPDFYFSSCHGIAVLLCYCTYVVFIHKHNAFIF
jgi:Ca2+/Na+ antiporter